MSAGLVLVVFGIGLGGSGEALGEGEARTADREGPARVAYLIEMLASRNAPPSIVGDAGMGEDETITFRKPYDKALQVPVYLAAQQLLAEGEPALDLLLHHRSDDRYSFSLNQGSTDRNVSVSGACRMIAERIILPFEPELHEMTRDQFEIGPLAKSDLPLEAWWEKNKGTGLRALQLESIDVCIAFFKTVDRQTASTLHPDAERLPPREFERLRRENLRILASIRGGIVAREEPYRATSLDDPSRHVFGLPWTTRKHNK